jgi:hypothetical protein
MKIITPPLEISETTPFEEDLFRRKRFAETLTNLIKNTSDQLVVSIDSRWGEGKTTFIKKWQVLLGAEGIPNIYIDAFKNDHTDDAFMVVASAITDYTKKHASNQLPALIERVKKVGVGLLSWSAKIGLKAATLNVIKETDIDELKDIGSDLSNDFGSLAGKLIEKKLLSHKEELESIESFKIFLSNLSSAIDNSSTHPLTIIIDELDRCRPSFAVEILEKIKHLFSVENVIFILVINKEQLQESIRTLYGSKIDAHSYLQKFINIEASLPKSRGDYSDIKSYTLYLMEAHEVPERAGNDFYIFFHTFAEYINLSLRQLERSITSLALAATIDRGLFHYNEAWLAFCCIMKATQPDLLKELHDAKITAEDLYNKIHLPSCTANETRETELIYMMRSVLLATYTDIELKNIRQDSPLFSQRNRANYSSERRHFMKVLETFLTLTSR